jgi:CheY-like chemotaxis protein
MATVFIVEDDAMVRVLAESVIQSGGYETLTAGSLAEAKSIIESNAKLDIVFTDLTLFDDHDGGVKVGNLVLQARPGTPMLYTSGREMTDGLKSLLIEGSEFLSKPYTDEQVTAALSKLLSK